jgi:hypothetical protein
VHLTGKVAVENSVFRRDFISALIVVRLSVNINGGQESRFSPGDGGGCIF